MIKLENGDIVSCYIDSVFIPKGEVYFKGTAMYLLNNVKDGSNLRNVEKKEWMYDWSFHVVGEGFSDDVKNVKKLNSLTQEDMNLVQILKMALKGEPEKSLIEVGILDSNEDLTEDGTKLFLSYLLNENKEDFAKEVVDVLKKAQEKK